MNGKNIGKSGIMLPMTSAETGSFFGHAAATGTTAITCVRVNGMGCFWVERKRFLLPSGVLSIRRHRLADPHADNLVNAALQHPQGDAPDDESDHTQVRAE